ncbi:unnamed protein product [Arctia plantaginis]|uniref:RRM domain-containing protein n=1 Tax=Arctia plantaginis TaxID=874455 RepID=A0A8S0ZDY5_ARCPL|nr:unnamed protein product [Arctia plantaginis]
MRRKSERTANKKTKASPEKKVEKPKRTKARRKKQSSSSENDSPDEGSPVREVEKVVEVEKIPPQTPVTGDSTEDAQDQVWQVKTAEGSGDVGEIQKLKICLTRPPSTPERADRSPRSKRKHSRATSSSDTPSVEGVEEKKKPKHRAKRSARDKDDTERNTDSHEDEQEAESEEHTEKAQQTSHNEISQSESPQDSCTKETPMSTTTEEVKQNEEANVSECGDKVQEPKESNDKVEEDKDNESQEKGKGSQEKSNRSQEKDCESQAMVLDADTTVVSPKMDTKVASPVDPIKPNSDTQLEVIDSNERTLTKTDNAEQKSPEQERGGSVEKSEVLELHAEDSKCESSDNEVFQTKEDHKEDAKTPQEEPAKEHSSDDQKVSKNEETDNKNSKTIDTENSKTINKNDVVESSDTHSKRIKERKPSTSSEKENLKKGVESRPHETRVLQRSDSLQSTQELVPNGQPGHVIGRKRRWGSRSSKVTTQKSITISTDVLKDIIPDVKPVEFDEVIEEKKHKGEREVKEKVDRPILPKIVIDNTDNVELKKEHEEKDHSKSRDLASHRKISIIKDSDSIIARPPSPPRNKQSCILYITNLVRPFTLPQLKNLLQRTGRIVDNGFWIDRIKSKCFVQYETEDQAVETRHALHGVTWPVSNPKTLQVDFSTAEAFEKAKLNEETDSAPVSTIPGTVEDWLREQDMKRERGELEKPWERKTTREWDLGKNDKDKEKDKLRRDDRPMEKRRHRSLEKSPEPARKFKKKEEEAPAKLLDDLFRKTKTTPCIYWLPLSAETIAIKEEQRRQHMAEHERRLQELRRTHRRH